MASAVPQASPAPFPQLWPSPLALTHFDQAWKQPGLLFNLGNRSDGSQEPLELSGSVCWWKEPEISSRKQVEWAGRAPEPREARLAVSCAHWRSWPGAWAADKRRLMPHWGRLAEVAESRGWRIAEMGRWSSYPDNLKQERHDWICVCRDHCLCARLILKREVTWGKWLGVGWKAMMGAQVAVICDWHCEGRRAEGHMWAIEPMGFGGGEQGEWIWDLGALEQMSVYFSGQCIHSASLNVGGNHTQLSPPWAFLRVMELTLQSSKAGARSQTRSDSHGAQKADPCFASMCFKSEGVRVFAPRPRGINGHWPLTETAFLVSILHPVPSPVLLPGWLIISVSQEAGCSEHKPGWLVILCFYCVS